MSNKKPLTDIEKELQQIALLDWHEFTRMIGNKGIQKAKICLLRKKKKSYGEICVKLGLTEHQARYACGNCNS